MYLIMCYSMIIGVTSRGNFSGKSNCSITSIDSRLSLLPWILRNIVLVASKLNLTRYSVNNFNAKSRINLWRFNVDSFHAQSSVNLARLSVDSTWFRVVSRLMIVDAHSTAFRHPSVPHIIVIETNKCNLFA